MSKFVIQTSTAFDKTITEIVKSSASFDKAVQQALSTAVYKALGFGDLKYLDRLYEVLHANYRKRIRAMAVEFAQGVYLVSDKQRAKLKEAGKSISDSSFFKWASGKAPQTHTKELETQAQAHAAEVAGNLPHWREWKKPETETEIKAKPLAFGKLFGSLYEKLSAPDVIFASDLEAKQAASLKSFAQLIQSEVTLEQFEKSIRAQVLAEIAPKPATRKRAAPKVSTQISVQSDATTSPDQAELIAA